MFTEARKLLLMINDVSPRGHFFEPFAACVGFISLNSDRYLEEKLAPSGDRLLTKQQRLALIEMATAKIPWLQSCAEHHKESVQDLRHKWPALHFEHFEMNGADDVVKYQKWQYTLPLSENPSTIHHHGTPRKHARFEGGNDAEPGTRRRYITMGRPGSMQDLREGMMRDGVAESAVFLLGPVLPDISSTRARADCKQGNREALLETLHPDVADWLLSYDKGRQTRMHGETNAEVAGRALDLPHLNADHWACVSQYLQMMSKGEIESLDDFLHYMQQYLPQEPAFQRHFRSSKLVGLGAALRGEGGGDACSDFFTSILPYIAKTALALPERMQAHGLASIDTLPQLSAGDLPSLYTLPREVCECLVANMFLCTFPEHARRTWDDDGWPDRSFVALLCAHGAAQEHAKLRMFIHYFERCLATAVGKGGGAAGQGRGRGQLHIIRRRADLHEPLWAVSAEALVEMEVVPPMVGFEDEEYGGGCLHADFANMYLGGGVLSGGCVQEEIRFGICPELLVGLLLCPVMTECEAIQIVGAEQFSAYTGYMRTLRYAGDHFDKSCRTGDGTVLNGIAAIDALDGRCVRPFDLLTQMSTPYMLREMNKASAGFTPPDLGLDEAPFTRIATGNWGCGAFRGFVELKAVLQWLAASRCRIPLRYFPYSESFGPRLHKFCASLVREQVTVGELWKGLLKMRSVLKTVLGKHAGFLEALEDIVIKGHDDSERPTDTQTDTQTQRQPGPTHTIVKMGGVARLQAFKEGPTCRFLGKHLSDVAQLRKATESSDEETHRRLLRVTPTVTEKGLARAIDDCDTKKLVGTKDERSESAEEKEARQKERLERIASKEDGSRRTKEDLIAEYVSRMHQEYEQLRSLAASELQEFS